MALSENRKNLLLVIYDKLVIGLLVASLSAALVYLYSVYSKAIDAAQTQSAEFLTASNKLRDEVINNGTQATQKFLNAYVRGETFVSQDDIDAIYSLATQIRSLSAVIEVKLPESAAKSIELAGLLEGDASHFITPDSLNNKTVNDANKKISQLQADFYKKYVEESSRLATVEFQTVFQAVESQLPIYLRPQFLLSVAVSTFIFATAIFWWVLADKGKPDELRAPSDSTGDEMPIPPWL